MGVIKIHAMFRNFVSDFRINQMPLPPNSDHFWMGVHQNSFVLVCISLFVREEKFFLSQHSGGILFNTRLYLSVTKIDVSYEKSL